MIKLEGKKVIVTGAASNLGRTICEVLGKAGAFLAIVDNNGVKGQEVLQSLITKGINSKFFKTDITESREVQKMVECILEEWGQVDILINSAGEISGGLITEITDEEWDEIVDVHLKGTFLSCRAVIPYMIKEGKGKIVNITSVEAKQGFSLAGVHYSAAKGGVMAFTKQLAIQVSPLGIHVNCVAPGLTEEEILMLSVEDKENLQCKIPLGRLAKNEDIAYAVLFLASPMAEFLTGETIDVNGGKYFS